MFDLNVEERSGYRITDSYGTMLLWTGDAAEANRFVEAERNAAELVGRLDHPAYGPMLREAERIGWPQSYRRDLERHDRVKLAESGALRFAWFLYPSGTHLVYDQFAVASVDRAFRGESGRWFYWTGSELVQCSADGAAYCLALWNERHGR